MTRKLFIAIGIGVAAIILGFGIYQSNASQSAQILPEDEMAEQIKAQYPGEVKSIDLQGDMYVMTIQNQGTEYELKVDGYSGEIIQLKETRVLTVKEMPDEKQEDDKTASGNSNEETEQKATAEEDTASTPDTTISKNDHDKNQKQDKQAKKEKKANKKKDKSNKNKHKKNQPIISQEEAIQIALNEFSGKVDDIDLDEEDGRLIYEIEIERGDLEADIEIDAYTGEVILIEIDD